MALGAPSPLKPSPPGLRLHHVHVFVADQDRSLAFFRDQLGFRVAADGRLGNGERFILVEPPAGNTSIALLTPRADSPARQRIGRFDGIVLVTADVHAQYEIWRERGVRFLQEPVTEIWGGTVASFEDLDGNRFMLAGWDAFTRAAESERAAREERQQAEKRAAVELDLARDVQARLFPQCKPSLPSLDYAGRCTQSRAVGGDYFDFLDFGHGHAGLLVGDVAGKGVAAALMMANLQANVRAKTAVLSEDLAAGLGAVNRLFYDNSPRSVYATLFLACYETEHRVLTYANCGHVAALLIRASGSIERLASNGGVIGLFPDLDCSIERRQLNPGDLLVIVSDGVTEAAGPDGTEFSEEGVTRSILANLDRRPDELIDGLCADVQNYVGGEQQDDITVMVGRVR